MHYLRSAGARAAAVVAANATFPAVLLVVGGYPDPDPDGRPDLGAPAHDRPIRMHDSVFHEATGGVPRDDSGMTVSGKHQVIAVLEQLLSQRCDGHPADWEANRSRIPRGDGRLAPPYEDSYANRGQPVPADGWTVLAPRAAAIYKQRLSAICGRTRCLSRADSAMPSAAAISEEIGPL